MQELIQLAKKITVEKKELPFSVYSCLQEQRILNAPIIKPLLICVFSGVKELKAETKNVCPQGSFIFLANTPSIDMRNIPNEDEKYFAVMIEFEYSDFNQFEQKIAHQKKSQSYFQGKICSSSRANHY